MKKAEIEKVQRACNRFTHKHLKGIAPLIVDGKMGHHTRVRIIHCKFWLGYIGKRDAKVDDQFLARLAHPRSTKHSTPERVRRGIRRRIHERHRWRVLKARARATRGVTTFDGVPVAAWMVRYLVWARANGWHGRLVSGFRTAAYSESLCYRMCGAPRCPGRCAGRSTNHTGYIEPAGAVDVSDYENFAKVIARCPYDPGLKNHLPSDRVHFSPSGN